MLASNDIGAKPGDFVEVEPTGIGNISVSVIVFVLPCVFLALGYMIGQSLLGLGDVMALLTAALGLVIGFIPAYLINRSLSKSKAPEFRILKYIR